MEKTTGIAIGKTSAVRLLACVCAALICMSLAACGGSQDSGSASSASSTASSSSAAAANPAEKFVGDWKLAAAETEGLTMTGDFSSGILGEDIDMTLSLAAGGTGTMTFVDESAGIAWELKGDDSIVITPNQQGEDITTGEAVYENGVLALSMDSDDFSGKLYLSKDGTMPGLRTISAAGAGNVTSEAALVGSWRLSGMNMMGMSLYGSTDGLAEMVGDSSIGRLEIAADGTADFIGEPATWKIGEAGASLDVEDTEIPVKSIDGDLVIDIGELMGEAGFELVLLFSK